MTVVSVAALLSACGARSDLPVGAAAFPAVTVASPAPRPVDLEEYQIGPRDILMVSVFNEPGLTFEQLPVSSGGTIAMPLIGTLPASGKTAAELANDINARLNTRYLRNARTAVSVVTATNYTVTVDGAVIKPGIYDIPGRLMLSQALAVAGGAAQFAKMNEIVVFRDINGQRYAARFDMNDIRTGQAPDFQLRQRDTVVVGYNSAAAFFRDIVTTLPSAAAVFVALR
ncbi:polysaccharide export protein [Sphingomonas sp. BT553]|uniref:Polysaccharide export protein n=1 Tax=Sphingomonas mollis TaxID=2795726 RepID=A0ABS0XUC4_9SPHN|nr:polysaccharide export protein [Sphingomonas sp. BT553]